MEFQQVITTNRLLDIGLFSRVLCFSTYVGQFPELEKHFIVFFIGMRRSEYGISVSASLFVSAKHPRLQKGEFIAASSLLLHLLLQCSHRPLWCFYMF